MLAMTAGVAVLALAAIDAAQGASAVAPPAPVVEAPRAADSAPAVAPSPPEPEVAAPAPPPAPTRIITHGELRRGDTLAAAMRRENVAPEVIHAVVEQAAAIFDFRRSQPGHRFRLVQDLDGQVVDFRYQLSNVQSIHVHLVEGAFLTEREDAELVPRVSLIAGVVTSSLYDSLLALGEGPQLANDFANVFAWDVDFSRSVQAGDEFRILYERLYRVDDDGNESYVGPGRILAARYGGSVGEHTAVYYEAGEGHGGYYRADGSSVERQFLMAPLSYSRISSSYTSARRHPILNVTRPHYGIDYAAKEGSPVWSIADGEVIYRGWAGGFGNLVKIRHAKGYVSYYAHLSGFARGLRVGDHVRQKQVIGRVGHTGLATGPHVCFRVTRNGSYVNPARVEAPAAKPIPDENRDEFYAVRDELLSELDAGPFVATGDAL